MSTLQIFQGDCRAKLRELSPGSVQCVVTSPPYWALRDYGTEPQVWGGRPECVHAWEEPGSRHRGGRQGASGDRADRDTTAQDATVKIGTGQFCQHCGAWRGELGLEPTPSLFVEHTLEVFAEVWRVLKDDGTLWMNFGDSYASCAGGYDSSGSRGSTADNSISRKTQSAVVKGRSRNPPPGLKRKDLVGMPWRVAFALQDVGWYLRQDIIWEKLNPMPESVTDRCTKSHEYLFLLTKSPDYYFDAEAIKEPVTGNAHSRGNGRNPKSTKVPSGWDTGTGSHGNFHRDGRANDALRPKQNSQWAVAHRALVESRNKRSVWRIPTQAYSEAHYATFPEALVMPCILAGSRPGDVVLDPFGGSGTVGKVALELGRDAVMIELKPENVAMIEKRTATTIGLGI